MEGLDPTKIGPLLIGPGGALFALLAFIGYLIREVSTARKESKEYLSKYEDMREQRDEFRYLAGDAVRAGKRSSAQQVAISRHKSQEDSNL